MIEFWFVVIYNFKGDFICYWLLIVIVINGYLLLNGDEIV